MPRFLNAVVITEHSGRYRIEDDDTRDPMEIAEELYAEGELQDTLDNHEIKEAYIEEAMF